jgi:Na+-driven multidrug efflux pump
MSDFSELNFKSEVEKNNFQFMNETKISKLVTKMAVPSIVSMLVLSIYSLSDIYFVSKLGTSASAAVGIVFSVMTLIQAFSFMLGTGAGSLIARYLGAGKLKNTDEIASVTFFSSLLGDSEYFVYLCAKKER